MVMNCATDIGPWASIRAAMRAFRLMRPCVRACDRRSRTARRRQPDRDGQGHAHADRADELGVGLAEEFADEAEGAVAQEEQRRDQAGPLMGAKDAQRDLQDHEQQHAFQRRFVKLAGMARHAGSVARKDHRPGHVGGAAPQFAIDEIGQPAEEQADGREGAGQVRQRQHLQLAPAAEQPDRDHHAQQPAMERHAAFPGGDDADGIGEEPHRQPVAEGGIVGRDAAQDGAIDQHPAQPSAQDDAEGGPHHQVADLVLGGGRLAVEGRTAPTGSCWRRTRAMPHQASTMPAI